MPKLASALLISILVLQTNSALAYYCISFMNYIIISRITTNL
jgi:hypothetical protein